MRYTLRLLTLDQLGRASTLICALELERQRQPEKLGSWPFESGLWVGQAGTPNRMGGMGDSSEATARMRVLKDIDNRTTIKPIPMDTCPWCGVAFGKRSLTATGPSGTAGVFNLLRQGRSAQNNPEEEGASCPMQLLLRLLGAAASHGLLTGQIVFSTAFVGACEPPNWIQGPREVNACRLRSAGLSLFFPSGMRGVFQPGKHFRRWGCTQSKGPLQWHLENVEAAITGWSKRNLRG